MIAPVASARTENLITVTSETGASIEITCPAAVIGNPIARQIAELDRWRTEMRPRPPWQLRDAGDHESDLRELLTAMPAGDRYLSIEPGWYRLTVQCWRQLRRIDPDCVVTEVKEKVGELRISAYRRDGQINARFGGPIGWARKQSLRTCEWCGGEADPGAAEAGHPSRSCPPCREFQRAWLAAWKADS